eukprot:1160796-Pelagomonas_calceolata.AAC.5
MHTHRCTSWSLVAVKAGPKCAGAWSTASQTRKVTTSFRAEVWALCDLGQAQYSPQMRAHVHTLSTLFVAGLRTTALPPHACGAPLQLWVVDATLLRRPPSFHTLSSLARPRPPPLQLHRVWMISMWMISMPDLFGHISYATRWCMRHLTTGILPRKSP